MVETTDVSKTAEDVSPSISLPDATKVFFSKISIFIQFSPFSNHLPCQTLPEDTFTQEQESDSLPIENDPVVVDTQTIDSQV